MTQIGCNYSAELMTLLRQNKVDIDWIKIGNLELFDNQFNDVNGVRPILLHGLPQVLSRSFPVGWNNQRINQALSDCKSPHVGLHLFTREDDVDGTPNKSTLIHRIIEYIQKGKSEINCTYLIENMPLYCLPQSFQFLADPEVISEICKSADVGLLLDLSHLKISAWNRDETENSYLLKLPLDRVKEIHINGPRSICDKYYDMHLDMREEDYNFLGSALAITNPSIITLEYGGLRNDGIKTEGDLLNLQLNRLAGILKR
jgi:uncharacterized protein (UPF0276 family)